MPFPTGNPGSAPVGYLMGLGYTPTGKHKSGRYASYWNAFLFPNWNCIFCQLSTKSLKLIVHKCAIVV